MYTQIYTHNKQPVNQFNRHTMILSTRFERLAKTAVTSFKTKRLDRPLHSEIFPLKIMKILRSMNKLQLPPTKTVSKFIYSSFSTLRLPTASGGSTKAHNASTVKPMSHLCVQKEGWRGAYTHRSPLSMSAAKLWRLIAVSATCREQEREREIEALTSILVARLNQGNFIIW